jgi:hypothetical protein
MRLKLLFSLFALLFAACAPTPIDSGIEGHVTIGPICPVMQAGNPCPDQPYQATLTVLTSISKHKVIQFESDSNGYFRVALSPGEYILHPESPNVMPRAADVPFTVEAHQFTRVDVAYDSGIR